MGKGELGSKRREIEEEEGKLTIRTSGKAVMTQLLTIFLKTLICVILYINIHI